ncbi:carboxypeptidase-like regulatory domain-containing protein [Flavobacterium sp. HSC-61S13]|uniref:carboxypeptidase-like regulatory domain-containing protein n=1 Tax=Flavobacterium sp. HSC-61S13 TaxID=2910963 RepID=UPI0020A10F5B|nr:carboxypeptidase-like regulatory domain-containing protein [Flavobacterium sp. HSC-61S13]MCP1994533.1 hypothetical protein [Flavobacterium sp. HSC-61S13]
MRYFTVFLFLVVTATTSFAQQKAIIKGTVLNDISFLPIEDVNVINLTKVKGTTTNADGSFKIEAVLNDSIHFSYPGYLSIKIRVTNDWLNDDRLKVYLTEKSIEMNEIVIHRYNLTGFLEADTKLITLNDKMEFNRFRRNNEHAYFTSPIGTFFSPVDAVYNLFKGKSSNLKKISAIKEDQNMIALLQSRYDRETICGLLGITKDDIVKTLQGCNNSDQFIYTATDYQIYIALNECYDQARVLSKSKSNASL